MNIVQAEVFLLVKAYFEDEDEGGTFVEYEDFGACLIYKDYEFAHNLEKAYRLFLREWRDAGLLPVRK